MPRRPASRRPAAAAAPCFSCCPRGGGRVSFTCCSLLRPIACLPCACARGCLARPRLLTALATLLAVGTMTLFTALSRLAATHQAPASSGTATATAAADSIHHPSWLHRELQLSRDRGARAAAHTAWTRVGPAATASLEALRLWGEALWPVALHAAALWVRLVEKVGPPLVRAQEIRGRRLP